VIHRQRHQLRDQSAELTITYGSNLDKEAANRPSR